MSESTEERAQAAGPEHWTGEWVRGLLPLLVLFALQDGPSYGYAISATLAQNGIGDVKGGTLYPLLTRHELAGFVTVEWRPGDGGPGRKYFALTDAGRAEISRSIGSWLDFTRSIERFFTRKGLQS